MPISQNLINRTFCPVKVEQRPIYVGLVTDDVEERDFKFILKVASCLEGSGWLLRTSNESERPNPFDQGVNCPSNKSIFVPPKELKKNQISGGCRHSYIRMTGWQNALALGDQRFETVETATIEQREVMACYHLLLMGPALNRRAKVVITCRRYGYPGYADWCILMAREMGIKVYNLGNNDTRAYFSAFVKQYQTGPGPI